MEHQCYWQRGTITDMEGNEVFQIIGTEAWACMESGEVLQNIPVSCDPNELGLRCYKAKVPATEKV